MSEKKVSDLLLEKRENWFQVNVVANAPSLIAVFANFVVLFADYRVYDVMYQMTGSWWKALSASLACAVPFILWEIGWQYNHTTENWRLVSLLMAGLAFLTSIVLGVADYAGFTAGWAGLLLGGVVVLTGVHTVVGFLYYYNDPDVARRRRRAQALGKMQDQQQNAEIAEELLKNGASLLTLIDQLERRFDPSDVENILALLGGTKATDRPTVSKKGSFKPANSYAQEIQHVEKVANNNGSKPNPTQGAGK